MAWIPPMNRSSTNSEWDPATAESASVGDRDRRVPEIGYEESSCTLISPEVSAARHELASPYADPMSVPLQLPTAEELLAHERAEEERRNALGIWADGGQRTVGEEETRRRREYAQRSVDQLTSGPIGAIGNGLGRAVFDDPERQLAVGDMFSTIGNVVEAFSINRGLNLGKPPEPPARVGGKRVPGTVEAQSGRTGTPHRPLREDPAPVQIKEAQQLDEQRACEFLPTDNTPHPVPYSKLSRSAATELKSKSDNRAATREDVYRLEWERRFGNRRDRGIDRFFADEKQRVKAGQPGTRDWTPEQASVIEKGGRPKEDSGRPIVGHHKHNAADYPQKAADPENIEPVTYDEHLYEWHGGDFRNDTHGVPLNPGYKKD